jgi:Arc/MetJ-type ribon-helix-helix transcriptional regulator
MTTRDDTKDKHIHLVVTEGQKERWMALVEDNPQYDSLSSFVREAAEKQWARDRGEDDVPDAIDDMRNQILEELESIESNLMMFNENLENVRNQQVDEETVDDIVGGYVNALERQMDAIDTNSEDDDE